MNHTDCVLAHQLAEEIIKLDPNWSAGYSLLGWSHLINYIYEWSNSPKKSLEEALQLAEKAISLNATNEGAYGIKCRALLSQGQYDKAISEGEKLIALSPRPDNYLWYGYALNHSGRPKEAIKMYKKAIKMNPKDLRLLLYLGVSYCDSGQYKDAIEIIKKALYMRPNNILAHSRLAVTYSLDGQIENAQKEIDKILEIDPSFSAENYTKIIPCKNQADTDRILNALGKAGLK